MKQRIITALILAIAVITGLFYFDMLAFMVSIGVIVSIGLWEWTKFLDPKSRILTFLPMMLLAVICVFVLPLDVVSLSSGDPLHMSALVVGVVWWLVASLLVVTYPQSTRFWLPFLPLRYLFGLFSLIPFFCSMVMLRAVNYDLYPNQGAKLVLFVCLLVWAADTGAYFAGKKWGKRKMAPHVSPNKTIEGLMGGIIFALIIGGVACIFFDLAFTSMPVMLLIITLTVIASVFGDLIESMLKRVADIKDSSRLLPGHGGLLDRIDSLITAFPVFTLLYFFCQ